MKTENGLVRGIPAADPRIISYKGIPFAAPPVGELRWCAPKPAEDWTGIRDCVEFAPISMQSIPGLDETNILRRQEHYPQNISGIRTMNSMCSGELLWMEYIRQTPV